MGTQRVDITPCLSPGYRPKSPHSKNKQEYKKIEAPGSFWNPLPPTARKSGILFVSAPLNFTKRDQLFKENYGLQSAQ